MEKYLEIKRPPKVKLFCITLTLRKRLVILFWICLLFGIFSLVSGLVFFAEQYAKKEPTNMSNIRYFLPDLISGIFSIIAGGFGIHCVKAHKSKTVNEALRVYVGLQVTRGTLTFFQIFYSAVFANYYVLARYTLILVLTVVLGFASFQKLVIYRSWLIQVEDGKRIGFTVKSLYFTKVGA